MLRRPIAYLLPALLFGVAGAVAPQAVVPGRPALPRPVGAFFESRCYECHDADTQKGGLDLTVIGPDLSSMESVRRWTTIFDKLESGEMPPKKKPRPPVAELKPALDWIGSSLRTADLTRHRAEGRSLARRLNRTEYQNTVHDLLAVDVDLKEMLPEDGTANGFDNQDAALSVSAVLVERYLDAADAALDAAIVHGSKPETVKVRYSFLDDPKLAKHLDKVILKRPDAAVFTNEVYPPKVVGFKAPVAGQYRFRIACYQYNNKGKRPLGMLVYVGNYVNKDHRSALDAAYDIPEQPGVVEVVERLDPKETIRLAVQGVPKAVSKAYDPLAGPGLAVQWVEVEGPLIPTWPPESHTRLVGNVDPGQGTLGDAERIIGNLLPRAFRRPTAAAEVGPYLRLVADRLKDGYPFEQALRVGLKAVLCAPEFLYLKQQPGKLDDYALASRLSYFLWSSMPDATLFDAAAKGTLAEPAVLRRQVERMLGDPKAKRFTEDFTGQWLGLRNINATTPDKKLYPKFDDLLEQSMVTETRLFFDDILKNDASLLDFVDCDFSIVNQRLAELYDLPGITGQTFRKVTLPPQSHRGGVLTQAGVLKVTANGTNTSPVTRGVWVLDRILGVSLPPPPKNAGALEPDIRGATTIREQLAKHRRIESCATCHVKIDPPGYALENFDVVGGWREVYRSVAPKQPDGKKSGPANFPKVESDGVLSDGRSFKDITDFKKLILADKDGIARALTQKLLIYGTGHGLDFADRDSVKQIVDDERSRNYGFRSLVHEVVQSPVFLNK